MLTLDKLLIINNSHSREEKRQIPTVNNGGHILQILPTSHNVWQ